MKAFDESETPRYRERLTTLVDGLVDRRRQIAKLQAEEAELLRDAQCLALERMDEPSAFPDRPGDIPLRSIAAEIGAATIQSDRTVQTHMSDAAILVERFPATLAALSAGRISRAHASVITDAGLAIADDDARAAYEAAVLPSPRPRPPVACALPRVGSPISSSRSHSTSATAPHAVTGACG